ncbi:hypothetical protein PBC1_043 [Bacillus phage PBC1]|uniref:Uncharacterized protein n=1 Tax=Bacillus phage PBC1 TaxID=1161901 RepID=I1TLH7_9CAUD|nr:hypothetical protein PBC1_gp43 [Bacillus phage PBC1]AFE86279.1 hypothetical protein PBC1_043 [Bacillus phage PBC1]
MPRMYIAFMDEIVPNVAVSKPLDVYRSGGQLRHGKHVIKALDKPIHEDGNIYVYSWNRSNAENILVREFFRCQTK